MSGIIVESKEVSFQRPGKEHSKQRKSQYEDLEARTNLAYLKYDRQPSENGQKRDMFSFTFITLAAIWRIYCSRRGYIVGQ